MQRLRYETATTDNWDSTETLFGSRGICGGCWCMWWRKSAAEYERDKGDRNKKDFCRLVNSGQRPGLVFYLDETPVGWCSVDRRDAYPRLNRSRVLAKVDAADVWSLVCLHVRKDLRRQGLSTTMIGMATKYAVAQGATIVEAYPLDPKKPTVPAVFAQTGFRASFEKAGFVEVARRSASRPVMRYTAGRAGKT